MNNKFKEKELISNSELIGFIAVFLIILAILFPKTRLKEYILDERSNYNLARAYLKALVKAYPNNSDFVKYLIAFDLKLYDIKNAYKIVLKYKDKFNNDIGFQILSYKIAKELYFQTKNKKYKKEAKKILLKLLDKRTIFVLREAKSFNFLDLEFLAYKKLKIFNNDCLNLALYFKDYNLAEKIINKFYQKDKKLIYLIKKAQIEELLKKFDKASNIYLQIYKKTDNIKYFKKAFYVLVWNNQQRKAYYLVKKYENKFLAKKNIKILNMFLKFYLSTGRLKDARKLALKIKRKFKI